MSSILVPLPERGFDPTEAAVPWKILSERGHDIIFATPDGKISGADPIMVTGKGLGILKAFLRADANGRAAYAQMIASEAFQTPITYDEARTREYDALLLPGGHDKCVRPYLESGRLQKLSADYLESGKPVAAICHGVLILARAKGRDDKPLLYGRKLTSLINRLENTGYMLTRAWMGDYYRTYPDITTEDEVRRSLTSPDDFDKGPAGAKRDTMDNLKPGFTVRDRNLLTARWPGDAHTWALDFDAMLREESE